jgi:hypothetical protein
MKSGALKNTADLSASADDCWTAAFDETVDSQQMNWLRGSVDYDHTFVFEGIPDSQHSAPLSSSDRISVTI